MQKTDIPLFRFKGEYSYYYYISGDLYEGDKEYYEFNDPINKITYTLQGKEKVCIIHLNDLNNISNIKITKECKIIIINFYDTIICFDRKYLETLLVRIVENIEYNIMELIDKKELYFNFNLLSDEQIKQIINLVKTINFCEGCVFSLKKQTNAISINHVVLFPSKLECQYDEINLSSEKYISEGTNYIINKEYKLEVGPYSPVYLCQDLSTIDYLNLPVYKSFSSRSPLENNFSVHGGKGHNKSQAYSSAIGEAYERYCSRVFPYDLLIIESYENFLKNNIKAINPEILNLDTNYINKYSPRNKYKWIKIKNITSNESIYFPANSVFFPYNDENKLMLHSQSTTGISSEKSLSLAVLKGIFEVLERDAYALTHKARLYGRKIIFDNVKNKKLKKLLLYLKEKGINFHIHILDSFDFIYVVHAILEDKQFPIYTHGSGAALDIEIAIFRAVTEAAQMRVSQIELKEDGISEKDSIYIKWGNGKKKYCKYFLNNSKTKTVNISHFKDLKNNDVLDDINFLLNKLKQKGFEVYVANLSRKDSPLKCVRVIIPGLQDIDNYNTRDTNRLLETVGNNEINRLTLFS
ncbi:YcaO-like family protein [Facklamia sp. DSM 111018]|uniref:YcaO-like family protein n=1 Tax=Facklamia lactis TaxID=2749967 RepID=A0ABS0LT36_9LACT|nr:YcaO-like family protein [Facklamia lactis]MBG9987340.1 YcaO-like family protein [Facklamia lactis]